MRRRNSSLGRSGFAGLLAFAAVLAIAAPTAAAPSAPGGGATRLADHVTDCNVTFDGSGDVLIDGSALTGAEAALLDALLLTDASLGAALEAAADADAEACINLEIDVVGASVTLNADIEACGAVTAEAGAITVGGVEIGADLLTSELSDLLTAAALADVDACAVITIVDNEAVVDAFATICANATLLDTGVVNVVIGSDEFFFDGTLIDASGLLDVGVTAEVNLTITATLDVAAETVDLTIVAAACAAGGGATPTPGGSPTPAPTVTDRGATPTPGAGASAPPLLPDTAAGSGGVAGMAALLGALLVLSLTTVIAARAIRGR